jgi:hypothetical protein
MSPSLTWMPQEVMKIVPAADEHYDLLFRRPDGTIEVFARVPIHRRNQDEALIRAELLSASFLMAHAISQLLDDEQPEGWRSDESPAWQNALVAHATSLGTKAGMMRWIPIRDPDGSS